MTRVKKKTVKVIKETKTGGEGRRKEFNFCMLNFGGISSTLLLKAFPADLFTYLVIVDLLILEITVIIICTTCLIMVRL